MSDACAAPVNDTRPPAAGQASPLPAGDTESSAARLVAAIANWQSGSSGRLVIAIDGPGAAGKTTLAGELARELGAELVHTDDYFHPARVGRDRRPMAQYYDWARLRENAILPALAAAGTSPSGQSGDAPPGGPGPPLVIEGVSSACPALADLVTHAVYIDTPVPLRLERLHTRIAPEEWDEDWLAAERVYFASRPPQSFDLVVPGTKITA